MPNATGPKRLRVPEGIPGLLRDLIHERTGIFFENDRMDLLLEKLEPAAQSLGCESFLDYYYALKDNKGGEWDQAWEVLSVQETYFWREMPQINALTKVIVPEWFSKRPTPFRLWSAACASGEEPYTIAIAMAEAGLGSHPIEITGSDANLSALKKAELGVYRERAFRALPLGLREKYFSPVPGGWKLSPEIASRVKFKRVNLFEPGEMAPLARAHAVFCRNVFIYFSAYSIRRTVATIALRMPPGGHLFVGAAESLLRMTTDFELKEIAGALAYVRI
ncbi:MAG TPA: protein-glutamate O-methyltransferase CheR [Verrucomicrobiae bacterium]|jgi:chemotaxis protein methyltransferase CheR|nr:protein-glutamate O-methyltransferase CheR [Verrucomicrobiae bacterium]